MSSTEWILMIGHKMQNYLSDQKRKKDNEINIIFRTLKCVTYNKMDELVLLY